MLDSYISKNLKDGESIQRIVKQYPLIFAIRLIFVAIVVLADFFFMTFFLQKGIWGFLLFLGILVWAAFFAFRSWYIWAMNVLLITDQRIIDIDQRGFFDRTVSETSYRRIQDVSYSVSGVLATVFRYGRIVIQTAGTQTRIELSYVREPEQVQDLITHLQDETVVADRVAAGTKTPNETYAKDEA